MNLGEITLDQIYALAIQTVAILGGAGSAVAWIYRKIIPAIKMLTDNTELTSAIAIKQSAMETVVTGTILPTLDALKKEIATNGGSVSIKDKVTIHEALLNTIADGMTTATYRCDPKGNCIWSNHSLQRLFGLSGCDMTHYGWTSVVDTAERDAVVSKWRHCVESGSPYEATYNIVNRLSGQSIRCRTFANPHRHPVTGNIVFWSGSVVVEPSPLHETHKEIQHATGVKDIFDRELRNPT